MTSLHTADLQIAARFAQLGKDAEALRKARLDTLRRVLGIARDRNAQAVLIAALQPCSSSHGQKSIRSRA